MPVSSIFRMNSESLADSLIYGVWCPFQHNFTYITAARLPENDFVLYIFSIGHLLLSYFTIIETIISVEESMIPVTRIVINPWKRN